MSEEYYQDKTGEKREDGGFVKEELMPQKSNKRGWSVLALLFGILSVAFVTVQTAGFITGLLAASFSVISRAKLGYFDKLSLLGLIVGVFGAAASGMLMLVLLNPDVREFVGSWLL